MEVAYVCLMRNLALALDVVEILDSEMTDCLAEAGLALLTDDLGKRTWFTFAKLHDPSEQDKDRALSAFNAGGAGTDLRIDQLLNHPCLKFRLSGAFSQIVFGVAEFLDSANEKQPTQCRRIISHKPN